MHPTPRLFITLGDVAGIGPEIVVKAWPKLLSFCQPTVIGDAAWLRRFGSDAIPCINPTTLDLSDVQTGRVSAVAGRAAYEYLTYAIDHTLAGEADGIVTAPLHKEGLAAAGVKHPGHTEILAERTHTPAFAMVLYGDGIAVAHVTLHMALRDVFAHLSVSAILEKIRLLDRLLPRLKGTRPRLAVGALNPHASDGGLFGDEEARFVVPAVAQARAEGIDVVGPVPTDAVFLTDRFDGIVALYHDAGHIAMKLRSGRRCVNISAGLPIVRTSVAHGTAYDIAGKGIADPSSLVAAAELAAQLANTPERNL